MVRTTKLLLLAMLLISQCMVMCKSWIEDVAEEAINVNADWDPNTFSQSLGLKNDDATQNMKYKAEDAASRATDSIKSAASGASEYVSQKATDTKDAISGAMEYGREKTSETYNGNDEIIRMATDKVSETKDIVQDTYEDANKKKLNTASDKASNMAHNVYDEARKKISDMASSGNDNTGYDRIKMASQKMHDGMGCESGEVDETFDRAKQEVSEAYLFAKNSMSEEAKTKYEAAKEKASEATGNLGAKMRNTPQT